jgi:PAS domain S-box-containing protein
LQKFLSKVFPWKIQRNWILLESALFMAAYIVWVVFRPAQSAGRLFIGSLAVLVPGVTAVLLIFRSLPQIPPVSQPAWRLLGLGLACWSLGNLVRTFYQAVRGIPAPVFSLADVINFFVYPLFFFALFLYPFENRYAPLRFRFLLDVTISTAVVATLVWLMLSRSISSIWPAEWIPLIYPVADLVLLMILVNMLLANRKARKTLFLWGCGLSCFLISDYIYSLLAPVNGYIAGGPESLGWTAGGLIFCCGTVFLANSPLEQAKPDRQSFDLGARIQNVLPFSFVMVLDWFVLANWRLGESFSWVGVGAGAILTAALVVRMGVLAGENELYKYWQLFSSMAEPIFICDRGGKILLGNPALIRIMGLRNAHEIKGKHLAAIFEDQTLPRDLLQLASQQECSLEVWLRPNRTPYLLSLSPIFSVSRKIFLAGAAHDLSDQKRQQATTQKNFSELQVVHRQLKDLNAQLEHKVEERTRTLSEAYRQLEQQNKTLQELDQLKSDFVSMVSHELRTPLTSLVGGLDLLLLQKNRPAEDRSTFVLMKAEVGRLTRFVENILNVSATEAGQLHSNVSPMSLSEVIRAVLKTISSNPGTRQIRVCVPEDLPDILADEDILISILTHLLDNALKYAPESLVMVEAIRKRNRVRVQVSDNGPGIPEALRPLLFKRFQRLDTKDSQSVYGYGLGLYLSRRMLQAMQSDLAFEAAPGGGTRFYFHLKVAR